LTGATHSEPGLFELADGGTVFLDEIGELPLAVQAKLLRVLESGEVRRMGAVEGRHTDVQIIAATNRNLRTEVAVGRFRADLFYRLTVVNIVVPPLRQRRDDIPLLAAGFIREAAGRLGKPIAGATPEAEKRLIDAPWDGNVRELRNVIEHACLLADGDLLTEHELGNVAASSGFTAPCQQTVTSETSGPSLADLERARILEVLRSTSGNKMAAARILGLSRRALYRRLQRYGCRT
jgi:transcriptional regulator with GAF, ATPase, and Fis domain